ncbi:IGHMBP2 family helicase [Candidatus Woesearchaeota archaeon]|nr:IGHMBP2 family helicase [Candidatus Woesearchaeota archaeon]
MNINEYTSKFKTLIERERRSEKDLFTDEIKNLSASQREKRGRTLTGMKRQSESESIFRFTREQDLGQNEFNIGSNVLISLNDPLNNSLEGVVTSRSTKYIDIQVTKQSNLLYKDNLRIDLYVNDMTFDVQKEVLNHMKDWTFEKRNIKEILLFNQKPQLDNLHDVEFYNYDLNESQKLAVRNSLREKEFYLIQGPPGTGKTKSSIEIIRQHLKQNKTVLVTADSNTAVDNIMMGLLKYVNVIRIGESPKIMPEIQEHTLNNLIKSNPNYMIVDRGLEKIKSLRAIQRNETIPNKENCKGLSYFQIQKMAERRQKDFGLSAEKIQSMSKWISAQNQIKEIIARVDKTKRELIKSCIASASVICTTNTNSNSQYLENLTFDLVLIDEAGQSTEPSCLIPISKAKKVILVGDHKQLPPTILSQDAKELSISMFERMMNNCRYSLLDTQYRMHPLINEFPSGEFYNGLLKSADSTKMHTGSKVFDKNVVFIECFGIEKTHTKSFFNLEEVEVVVKLIEKYASKKYKGEDIGVISPYNGQVKKIKDRMPFVEVNTIDGFQGREKNIIIISLVRSKSELGFLKDLRRLNVALTRAITELVVIGNPDTISTNPTYKRFLEFVKNNGTYIEEKNLNN